MSYNIDAAEGFLHTFLLAEISPEIEDFNRVLNRNLTDLSSKIIEKIFTTALDPDLCKPSSTNREWNTSSDEATLYRGHIHINNVCRKALCTAHPEAIASTSQRMNCLLQSRTYIDPIKFVQQMVEDCPELRSSFSTSFLHDAPLTVVWDKLKEQNPERGLPNFPTATAIRQWIKREDAKQILSLIKKLDLSHCNLLVLPPEIGQLADLKELYLQRNQFISLPATIGKLAALEVLNLSLNQLISLPTEIGKLLSLKVLFLAGNQLTSLPATIGKLTALQRLFLWENQLASLPATIRQLTTLRLFLSADQRPLHQAPLSLPPEIGQLAALQKRLEGNQLASLPLEIEKLAALQKLHRESTRLSSRPKSKKPPTIG